MTPRELEEYRVLRDTIRRARNHTESGCSSSTLVAWAALTIATAALAALPVATLLPLLVLAVGFERRSRCTPASNASAGTFRCFSKSEDADRGWEHRVMAYGDAIRAPAAIRCSPHTSGSRRSSTSSRPFLRVQRRSNGASSGCFTCCSWCASASRAVQAHGQRAIDLERFRQLKADYVRTRPDDTKNTKSSSSKTLEFSRPHVFAATVRLHVVSVFMAISVRARSSAAPHSGCPPTNRPCRTTRSGRGHPSRGRRRQS